MPITPGSVGTDLFQRKVATPYSGPPVAPPVGPTLPTNPVVPPPVVPPTTGGVVGGGQPTGRSLGNPIDTSYNYTQIIGRGAPRNTGAVPGTLVDLPGTSQGSPRNTDAVPGNTAAYNSPLIGRGAPANTGAVPERTMATPRGADLSLIGVKTVAPVVKKATLPNFQATAAAKLGLTPKVPVVAKPNTFMADQRAKTAKLLRGGR